MLILKHRQVEQFFVYLSKGIPLTNFSGDPIEVTYLKKIYNVVNFEYSSEALDQKVVYYQITHNNYVSFDLFILIP